MTSHLPPRISLALRRLLHLLQQHRLWRAILLFIFVISLFTWALAEPYFADPDAFYHIGMAEYLAQHHTIPHQFPWLSQTTLSAHYTDHHFLYHLLLVPFVTIVGPMTGTKLLTILLAGTFFVALYAVLSSERVPYPFVWCLILLTGYGFLFRLGLVKATAVSLIFCLMGIWLYARRSRRAYLFPLGFFFVWSYGGFIVLALLGGSIALGHGIYAIIQRYSRVQWKKVLLEQTYAFACLCMGMLFGLLIHPSFPDHLYLLWQQIVDIGIVNQRDVISVGREWYAPTYANLPAQNPLVALVLVASILLSIRWWKQIQPLTIGIWIFAAILFAFTLKSQRYIEYSIPLIVVACAFAFRDFAPPLFGAVRGIWTSFKTQLPWVYRNDGSTSPLFIPVVVILFCLVVLLPSYSLASSAKQLENDLSRGIAYDRSAAASTWLLGNSAEGDTIYTSDWDIFPELFFYNQKNYYIVGLDPTFMYKHNAARYWEWYDINTGRSRENVVTRMRENFGARFILIENDNKLLLQTVNKDQGATLKYQDSHYHIYEINTATTPAEDAAQE